MALNSDLRKLDRMIGQAVRVGRLEYSILAGGNERGGYLEAFNFTDQAIDILMNIRAEDLKDFGTQAAALLEQATPIQTAPEFDLPLYLRELQFDRDFIDMFVRLATRKVLNQDEVFLLHFRSNFDFREAVEIENMVNALAYDIIQYSPELVEHQSSLLKNDRILRGNSVTHPGSSEIKFAFDIVEIIVNEPIINDILLHLIKESLTAALFYVVGYKLIRVQKQNDKQLEPIPIEPSDVLPEARKNAEKIIYISDYIIFHDGDNTTGGQKQ